MLIATINRLIRATGHSLWGLNYALMEERAFQLEIIASLALIPLAIYFGKTNFDKAILLSVWLLVLMVELLNSAIENVVDRIGPEQHPLSKRAKDIASAAVFIALLNCAMVWVFILI